LWRDGPFIWSCHSSVYYRSDNLGGIELMDNFLYIRVRGRVLGPYDQEKLQSLARRGQLSRMHELSTDGASWVRASNYPELFTGAQAEMPAPRSIASESAATPADGMSASPQQQTQQTQQQWLYTSGGVQRGPVDFSNLQLLMGTNQVRPEDLVWSEGMPAWIPANQIPGLGKASAAASDASVGGNDALSEMLCRSFTSSRPWLMFIVVAIFIYVALQAAWGLYLLVIGGRLHNPVIVGWGILVLILALDWAVGACLLGSYHSRLGSLLYTHSRTNQMLERAHQRLLAVWIYLAINLIVNLVFLGIGVIFILSAGVTLPWG
jgi:hypothetical protein